MAEHTVTRRLTDAELDEAERVEPEKKHPSFYILEEMLERRWGFDQLALEMGDDFGVSLLAMEMLFLIGPDDTNCSIGPEMDSQLCRAFGISEGFFLQLESAWKATKSARLQREAQWPALLAEVRAVRALRGRVETYVSTAEMLADTEAQALLRDLLAALDGEGGEAIDLGGDAMSATWQNQQPQVATEADCRGSWAMGRNGSRFRCQLCGHKFVPGETWRWVYCNDGSCPGGNFLVCAPCDGPDVKDRRADLYRRMAWQFA